MKINNFEFVNPDYGYETLISMPFHISKLSSGQTSIRDEGVLYDKWSCARCKTIVDRIEVEALFDIYNSTSRGQAVSLTEAVSSGFIPFTPLLPELTGYSVYFDKVRNKGAVDVLAKRFEIEFDLILEYDSLTYNPIIADTCLDGNMVIGNSGLEVEGIRYPMGGFKPSKSWDVYPVNTNGGNIAGSYYDKSADSQSTSMTLLCTEKNCRNILYRLLYNFRGSEFKMTVPVNHFPFGYDYGDDSTFCVKLTSGDIKVKHTGFNQFEIDLDLSLIEVFDDRPVDSDGNIYDTVIIGNQEWTVENWKSTKYNDGSDIPLVTNNTAWANDTTGARCIYNNNDDTYGQFYNWYAVTNSNFAPDGWRVPTDADWTALSTHLGGESVAGGKMKTTGTSDWGSPNTGATNSSGFTALPGGSRNSTGHFSNQSDGGAWWSATESAASGAWYRYLVFNNETLTRNFDSKRFGFFVRLVRDVT